MRKRHVWNRLYFGHSEYAKIRLPLMESIQRIMIRAEVFRQTLSANRSTEHPAQHHTVNDAAVDGKARDATRKLVHHEELALQGIKVCGVEMKKTAGRGAPHAGTWQGRCPAVLSAATATKVPNHLVLSVLIRDPRHCSKRVFSR
jgi:hypothetical protein